VGEEAVALIAKKPQVFVDSHIMHMLTFSVVEIYIKYLLPIKKDKTLISVD